MVEKRTDNVAEFRQILIWPLTLSAPGREEDRSVCEIVREQASLLEASDEWTRIKDPLFYLNAGGKEGEPDIGAYAEYVYFHDFVQCFLYPEEQKHVSGEAAFHLYSRNDVQAAKIQIGDQPFSAKIPRCHLYLFRTGVAILAVELVMDVAPIPLSDVLLFQDVFRRVYAPYFEKEGPRAALVPSRVEWLGSNGTSLFLSSAPPEFKDEMKHVVDKREPPVAGYWRWLIGLNIEGYKQRGGNAQDLSWRHIIDERIPFMSYLQLTPGTSEPFKDRISRGDWVRLCFADAPGDKPYPYDEDFLSSFEKDNCYDRYLSSGTRHMFCGYAYVAVTSDAGFAPILREHFRRMYFQLATVAQMEFATCLSFSSRVTRAVDDAQSVGGTSGHEFRKRILVIQEEFLEFVHLFRFTGVSNQLQAREMFDYWRRHLGVAALFEDVKSEIEWATNFLLAKEANKQTEAANNLNVIAVVGAALALTFSFLGMNVIAQEGVLSSILGPQGIWRDLGVAGAVLAFFASMALGLFVVLMPGKEGDGKHVRTLRRTLAGLIAAGGITVLLTLGLAPRNSGKEPANAQSPAPVASQPAKDAPAQGTRTAP